MPLLRQQFVFAFERVDGAQQEEEEEVASRLFASPEVLVNSHTALVKRRIHRANCSSIAEVK